MVNIVGSSRYKLSKKILKKYVAELLQKNALDPETTLNIVLIGKRKMKDIAKKYKHEDVALPILAFPYHEQVSTTEEPLLGEIFISYPQAVLLAAERGKKVDDMMRQLIEHGLKNLLSP